MFVAFAVELQMKLVDNQKITNMSALELNDLQKIQKQVDELRITQYLKLSKDEIDNELHLIEMELFKLMDKQCEGKKQPDTESKCNKHDVTGSAFDAVDLWNEATKLSTLECNGYWKALRDLERLSVIKIGGLEPD